MTKKYKIETHMGIGFSTISGQKYLFPGWIPVEDHISFDDVPIELCQEDILDRLKRSQTRQLTLQETFWGMQLQERIGMFLATLELVRLRQITIVQDEHFDSIIIKPIEEIIEG